jgi:hypothetical protein
MDIELDLHTGDNKLQLSVPLPNHPHAMYSIKVMIVRHNSSPSLQGVRGNPNIID